MPSLSTAAIVDGTLWTLGAFSVVTWGLIFIKGVQHLRVSHFNRVFNKVFWRASDLHTASELSGYAGPAARVAHAGFSTLRDADVGTTIHDLEHTGDRQELLDRRLRQQMQKERGALESGLAVLATIGSTARPSSACSARCGASCMPCMPCRTSAKAARPASMSWPLPSARR